MQTVIRSILGGIALCSVALGVGFGTLWLAHAIDLGTSPWYAVTGILATVMGLIVFSAVTIGRAFESLRKDLEEGGPGHIVSGPRWLRPVLRTLSDYQLRHRQAEAAWRTRQQDLEIRAHVAESGRLQAQAVLDVMDEVVIVCSPLLEVVSVNAAAARLIGRDIESITGQSVNDVVEDLSLRRIITSTLEAGVGGEPRRAEVSIQSHGDECSYEVVCACACDHRDRVSALVTVLRDLTREREISQMKSEFVSKASHELRTPLSSMRAYVEMLVDGEAQDEETRQEFYGIIQAETDRLARLVDNMLNISRIEAGIFEVERDMVDVQQLVERAVQTIEPQARSRGQALHTEIAPIGAIVEGDADMLQQVVLNLLSNAVKYTPEGGRITVSVDSDTLTRSVHVAVSDTGLGISPRDAEQVFEKFYRVENYKRVAKGTGLGLNLCRHIIERVHRGQIGLESTLGMGSRFWFSIPMSNEAARVAA